MLPVLCAAAYVVVAWFALPNVESLFQLLSPTRLKTFFARLGDRLPDLVAFLALLDSFCPFALGRLSLKYVAELPS